MESSEESIRLEIKTNSGAVREQAQWCGIEPGMRILDAGCGPGKTSAILHEMVQPNGSVMGIDYSPQRIAYAQKHYSEGQKIEYLLHDLREPLPDIGFFDVIWVRFVLEHHRKKGKVIIENLKHILKPGGVLCLLDLDHNCLNHYEVTPSMRDLLHRLMEALDERYDFDTYAGRKLYSYLYDNGFKDIQVTLMPHHLIYGEIRNEDFFNWTKKVEVAARRLKDIFDGYPGGYEGFVRAFESFFRDPRRFTYTALIICKGNIY